MKRHWKISLAVVGTMVLGFGGWFVTKPKEPVYQGKTFSQWYSEVRVPGSGSMREIFNFRADPAVKAVGAMGKSAVPFVIRQLWGMNSRFHHRMVAIECRMPGVDRSFDDKRFIRATFCFDALRDQADEAIPVLTDIAKGADLDRKFWAIEELICANQSSSVVVPLELELLHMPDKDSQFRAIFLLRKCGSAAKAAVPALNSQWKREKDPELRRVLGEALLEIDPLAAMQAGIKGNKPPPSPFE